MPWQAPQFTEIDMNAEIGAYQRDALEDADRRRPPQRDEARSGKTAPNPEQDAAPSPR